MRLGDTGAAFVTDNLFSKIKEVQTIGVGNYSVLPPIKKVRHI
jgi:hypothetical protein